ncbi:MAG: roadblock/LC7 domain-containing protein, partial [Actinomycetota bacterium]
PVSAPSSPTARPNGGISPTRFAPPPPPGAQVVRPTPTTAQEALDALTREIPGARGAILASIDGFPIACSATLPDEPAHAAMLAAASGLARQLVAMGGGEQLRQLVVDHDGGLLLMWPIGAKRVVAMLTLSTVDQSRLRGFVRAHARLLAGGA